MSRIGLDDLERLLSKIVPGKDPIEFSSFRQRSKPSVDDSLPFTRDDSHRNLIAQRLWQYTQGTVNLGTSQPETNFDALFANLNGRLIDDREYLLERIVALAASLPPDSAVRSKVTELFQKSLWSGLNRASFVDLQSQERYVHRLADGQSDFYPSPWLGSAGLTHTTRVVPPKQSSTILPDAGLVFDELFARREGFREHPSKISSIFFYFATIIVHDACRTDVSASNLGGDAPRLDLSLLYGNSISEQALVRDFDGGVGKLKPDVFTDPRILAYPPGVAILLICFNRFHNYIAEELLHNNEGGRFNTYAHVDSETAKSAKLQRDDDLFNTARLVTCGLYTNIISHDYMRVILNLHHTNSDWDLDARELSNATRTKPPTQTENESKITLEFSLLHRWHSVMSRRDEQWSIDFLRKMLHGSDPAKCLEKDLEKLFRTFVQKASSEEPTKWEVAGLARLSDGSFNTQDLVHILSGGTEDIAGAFGACNIPLHLRTIETTAIERARRWKVATLNEYRQYFGLIPYKSFDDITANPKIASALESLYRNPDEVELYVGFIVEDAKQTMVPGAGLCSGYTASRNILADILALLRDNRANAIELNATNLTNWGYNQIASDPRVAGGGVMYKLLMHAFPQYYKYNSVYAMFPFNIPVSSHQMLIALQQQHIYDFDPPRFTPKPIQITSWAGVTAIVSDLKNFTVPGKIESTRISHQNGFQNGHSAGQRTVLQKALYSPHGGMQDIIELYERTTDTCLHENSRKLLSGHIIDVIADVVNISSALVGAELFHMDLKTNEKPVAPFTPTEFHSALTLLSDFDTLGVDQSVTSQYHFTIATQMLLSVIRGTVESILQQSFLDFRSLSKNRESSTHHNHGFELIERLRMEGYSIDEVTNCVLQSLIAMVTTQAHCFVQILDLFLQDPHYTKHWPIIQNLARSNDPYDFEKLRKYAMEGMRLATAFYGVLRNVDCDDIRIQDGAEAINLQKGDQIFANFVTAGVDPTVFPHPLDIDIHRNEELYLNFGLGQHQCLGKKMSTFALAAQLKAFGKLKNLRRVPGEQGRMMYRVVDQTFRQYMTSDLKNYTPFPTSLKLMFDDFSPNIKEFGTTSDSEELFPFRTKYKETPEELLSATIEAVRDVADNRNTQIEAGQINSKRRSEFELAIFTRDHELLETILAADFDKIAQGEYLWLNEMVELEYGFNDIATLLIDEYADRPWIYFEQDTTSLPRGVNMNTFHHCQDCIHLFDHAKPTQKHKEAQIAEFRHSETSSLTGDTNVRQNIMELCGLAGLKPSSNRSEIMDRWIKQTSFTGSDRSDATITYFSNLGVFQDLVYLTLNHFVQDLRSILTWMQDEDLCCNSFTVLTKRQGEHIVEMHQIHFLIVEKFANALHALLLSAIPETIPDQLATIIREILEIFPIDYSAESASAKSTPSMSSHMLHLCSLSIQLICLALASYSCAHLGPLQPFFLDCSLNRINLLGFDIMGSHSSVVLKRCRLTCLEDMLKSDVLVFHSPADDEAVSERCDLLANPEDILDTWGPGSLILSNSNDGQSEICGIEIGEGSISSSPDSEKFHWTQGRFRYASSPATIDLKEKIVIGAIKINTLCPLKEEKSTSLCQEVIVPLGTSADSWEEAQRSIALQGGQYINVQLNYAWNKKPGVTVKDLILSSFMDGRARKSDLQARWGLQVSLCTGIARRVTLLELLADVARVYVENCMSTPPMWKKMINNHSLCEKFRDPVFWKWYEDELDSDEKISVVQIITYVLRALKTTGLDPATDELVVAWALQQDPFTCVRVRCEKNNFWARILVDSELCATFAYMTTVCIETSTHNCRNLEAAVWLNTTASLDTAVSRHRVAKELIEQRNDWTLELRTAYWIGKPGTDLLARVSGSANSSELRLSVQHSTIPESMRKRMDVFKRKQMDRIREPGSIDAQAKKVMICSE